MFATPSGNASISSSMCGSSRARSQGEFSVMTAFEKMPGRSPRLAPEDLIQLVQDFSRRRVTEPRAKCRRHIPECRDAQALRECLEFWVALQQVVELARQPHVVGD